MKRNQKGNYNNNYKHGLSRNPLYRAFSSAKTRCTNPNRRSYKTYKGRWGKNAVAELTLHYLKEYERFVRNNPGVAPSMDRIDNNGKYEIGNIHIISRGENVKKRNNEVGNPNPPKPVEGYIDGKWVRFAGGHEAERETGIIHQSISKACYGKRKTAGGYRWRYATL